MFNLKKIYHVLYKSTLAHNNFNFGEFGEKNLKKRPFFTLILLKAVISGQSKSSRLGDFC